MEADLDVPSSVVLEVMINMAANKAEITSLARRVNENLLKVYFRNFDTFKVKIMLLYENKYYISGVIPKHWRVRVAVIRCGTVKGLIQSPQDERHLKGLYKALRTNGI